MTFERGAISAPLTIDATGSVTTTTGDVTTISGATSIVSGGLLDVRSDGGGTSELNMTGAVTNDGTIRLVASAGTPSVTLDLDNSGSIDNTGTIIASLNSGGTRVIRDGSITNNATGLIDIDVDTTFNNVGLTNNASSTLTVQTGDTLNLDDSTFVYNGGTVDGSGTIAFSSGTSTMTLNAGLSFSTVDLIIGTAAGAVGNVGGSTLTLANFTDFDRGTISAPLVIDSGGSLTSTLNNVATISGTTQINSGGTLVVSSTGGGTTLLNVSGAITNAGTISLTSLAGSPTVTLDLDTTGSIANAGTIDLDPGAGGTRVIQDGSITNNATGLIDVDTDTTFNNVALTTNASSTLTVQTGDTLNLDDSTFVYNDGTINGAGTIAFSSGTSTMTLNTGLLFSTLDLVIGTSAGAVGNVDGAGTLTLANTTAFDRGVISAPLTIDNGGTVSSTLNNVATISGATSILSGGTLEINSTGGGTTHLNVSNGSIANAGTIRLIATSGTPTVTLDLDSTGIIANTGTIDLDPGVGGTRVIRDGAIGNNPGGLIDVDNNTTFNAIVYVNNTGSTLTIQTGDTLNLDDSTFDYFGGTVNGAGTLAFSSGTSTLTLHADLTFSTLGLTLGTSSGAVGNVDGSSTLTIANNTIFDRGTISAPLTIDNGGTVSSTLNNVATISSATQINSGGTLEVNATGGGTTLLNVSGAITNDGTIALIATSGTPSVTLDVTGGSLTNNGTIHAQAGVGGTRTITSDNLISAAGSVINVDADLTIAMGASGSFDSAGAVDVASGTTLAFTGSNAATDTIDFQAAGTVTVNAGGVLDTNGLDITNRGTTTVGGSLITDGADFAMTSGSILNVTGASGAADFTVGALNSVSGGTVNFVGGANGVTFNGALGTIGIMNFDDSVLLNLTADIDNNEGVVGVDTGTLVIVGGDFDNNGGNLSIASGATLQMSGTDLNLTTGNYTSVAGSTIALGSSVAFGSASFTAGNAGSGFTNEGTFFAANTDNVAGTNITVSGEFTNNGTTVLDGGSGAGGVIFTGDFANGSGGIVSISNNVSFGLEVALVNDGLFTVSAGGSVTFDKDFTNNLSLVLTSDSGSAGASFDVSSGATLINTGTIGAVGTVGVARSISGNLSNASGTIDIDVATTYSGGTLTYSGGTFDVASGVTFAIASGATLAVNSGISVLGDIDNSGTIDVAQGAGSSSVGGLVNQSGGLVILDAGASETADFTSAGDITNAGTIRFDSAHTGSISLTVTSGNLDNTGTIAVQNGSSILNTIAASVNNSGTLDIDEHATIAMGSDDFDQLSGGILDVGTNATLQFTGSNTAADAINFQSGGTVTVNSGSTIDTNGLDVTNDGDMTINGTFQTEGGDFLNDTNGDLTGFANLSLGGGSFTNNGNSDGGASPGLFVVEGGDAIFGATSTIIVEIGGTDSADYDINRFGQNFHMGGALGVVSWDGFEASAGDSFDIIEWGSSSGMFDEIEGLDAWGDVALDTTFTDSGLTLTAKTVTHQGDDDADVYIGTGDDDVMVSLGGSDVLSGADGSDLLLGGDGDDVLSGGAGDDRLIGGLGTDTADYSDASSGVTINLENGEGLDGDGGVDTLISIENLIGSDHDDVFINNARDNVMIGGDGSDTFIFNAVDGGDDLIQDFTSGEDSIVLAAGAFGFNAGTAQEGVNFSVIDGGYDGTNAGGNDAHAAGNASLVYSEEDSALYYDENGKDADGYSVVATLQPGAGIVADDIHFAA